MIYRAQLKENADPEYPWLPVVKLCEKGVIVKDLAGGGTDTWDYSDLTIQKKVNGKWVTQ